MDQDISTQLLRKMDILIGLTALAVLQGKPQRDQIEILSRAGLPPREIAGLVGTTSNTVRVTRSQAKKNSKRVGKMRKS